MWVSLLSYFEFVAGWLCFVFFTNDIFLYVLIAELSDSLHATLLWVTNTLTHTLFPPVTMLFKTNSLSFSCTHTQHHALLCSIMSPPLTVPEKISLSLGRPPLRSLSVHSYFFSPRCLAPFGSLSPVCLSFPLSLSLIPRSCETMSCNNTELNLCVKAVFPLH